MITLGNISGGSPYAFNSASSDECPMHINFRRYRLRGRDASQRTDSGNLDIGSDRTKPDDTGCRGNAGRRCRRATTEQSRQRRRATTEWTGARRRAAPAIIATGSRIKTNFNSSSPIAIIDPEMAEKRGVVDTAEMLQSSPIASGSSQVTSAISSNFVTDGRPGASTISLRAPGAARTLVLVIGRRAGPAEGTRRAVSSFDVDVCRNPYPTGPD